MTLYYLRKAAKSNLIENEEKSLINGQMNTMKGQIQRFKNKLDKQKTKMKRNSFSYSLSDKI